MRTRPFRLTDAMILVAAVAAGLWANRIDWRGSFPWSSSSNSYSRVDYILRLLLPHVAAMTVAVVAIAMGRPGPSRRRVARRPGTVACTVASAVFLLISAWAATTTATGRVVDLMQHVSFLPNGGGHGRGGSASGADVGMWLVVYGDRVGFTVAGAWLLLRLAGLWRAEATWIDRLGRIMGWLWIGLAAALWLRSLLL
ncbi:hypothetical protein [Aquisphaera insulae]|uniref:hypothetical protein n=1 Tax=Aquisphaera insulae TaxID=2712864 RepID=UPI0013EBB59C|nr:hypothetical protein [Aquisphaera insulae]